MTKKRRFFTVFGPVFKCFPTAFLGFSILAKINLKNFITFLEITEKVVGKISELKNFWKFSEIFIIFKKNTEKVVMVQKSLNQKMLKIVIFRKRCLSLEKISTFSTFWSLFENFSKTFKKWSKIDQKVSPNCHSQGRWASGTSKKTILDHFCSFSKQVQNWTLVKFRRFLKIPENFLKFLKILRFWSAFDKIEMPRFLIAEIEQFFEVLKIS